MGSDMCYWIITETGKLMSKTSVKHVTRDGYLKPYIESRVDDTKKKMAEWLENRNFHVDSDVDDKFDFILPDKDLSKNLGVSYAICVMPTDEEYYDMIVKGRPNYEDEVVPS